MSNAHYFYFRLSVFDLDLKVKAHQLDFDQLLQDTFSEEELIRFEPLLDEIGAPFVQPIFSEMTFNDFYSSEKEAENQRQFFEASKSSICLENIPSFESNPFQVTYLIELLRDFEEVLIDTGGVNELMFKKDYVSELKKFKNIFSLLKQEEKKVVPHKTSAPVDPIDFLIQDVYREMDQLDLKQIDKEIEGQPEKTQKVYRAMRGERLEAGEIFKRSTLIPKDFDDNLERLKFFLRKLRITSL